MSVSPAAIPVARTAIFGPSGRLGTIGVMPPEDAEIEYDRPVTGDVTGLLVRLDAGDESAADQLLPMVYERLRATAGSCFRGTPADHTLQPTALVHEAYLKLASPGEGGWRGREHFCAVAATAMRQILHDHARARLAAKRRPDGEQVPMTFVEAPSGIHDVDLVALDEVFTQLRDVDERGARVVELRFFGGLTNEEVARVLAISRPTVERIWRRSRAWLQLRLEGGAADGNAGP